MNWTHVLRIAWKDYRRMGAFWVALIAFWLVCLGYVTWGAFESRLFIAPMAIEQTFYAILITAMIYALGWGAITFAAEHEDKTYGFLRSLPIHAKSVYYGKLFFGVNSTILLIVALIAVCCLHAVLLSSQGGHYEWTEEWGLLEAYDLALTGLMIPLVMALSMFWSLRTRRPLLALGLSGGSVVVVLPLGYGVGGAAASDVLLQKAIAVGVVGTIALGLLFVDRWLVNYWLPNYQSELDVPKSTTFNPAASRQASGLGRLLWLHRRQSLWTSLGIGALAVLMWALSMEDFAPLLAILTVAFAGLLGTSVFRAEHQEHRFRLLAQFGVRPLSYWFSRLLMPVLAAIVIAFSLAGMGVQNNELAAFNVERWRWIELLLFTGLAVFSIGQFCSVAFPSTVIAIAMTLIAAIFVWLWFMLCAVCRIPWWLGYVPVVVLPLLASYLRIPRWFRDTASWRQWVVPLLPLILLAVGLPAATAFYRIQQVPYLPLPAELSLPKVVSAEEQEGAERYRKVFALLPRKGAFGVDIVDESILEMWMESSADVVQELVRATEGRAVFPEEIRFNAITNYDVHPAMMSASILLIGARRAEDRGEIDEAWKYYVAALNLARHQNDGRSGLAGAYQAFAIEQRVHERLVPWAMLDGNTTEQVETAAVFLDDYRRNQPAWTDALRGDYQEMRSLLEDPSQAFALMAREQGWMTTVAQYVPWELTRSRRLLDYSFARQLARFQDVQEQRVDVSKMQDGRPTELDQLARTTFFAGACAYDAWPTFVYAEHQRRGAIYQLAAIAHHRRVGAYPDDFQKVTIGGRELPDDFYSPGRKLLIAQDRPQPDRPASGLLILTNRANVRGEGTFSDAHGEARHFLLPNFTGWSPRRFAHRIVDSSQEAPARITFSDVVSVESGSDPFAYDNVEVFHDLLRSVDPELATSALRRTIEDQLLNGVEEQRLQLVSLLVKRRAVAEFLPEIKTLLDVSSPLLAAKSAAAITEAIEERMLSPEQMRQLDGLLSVSEGGTERSGVPILNHANGHYYEMVSFRDAERPANDWQSALELASLRRYRDMQGHLATITSQEENDFLVQAFATFESPANYNVAWVGASDAAEEGVWKWVCGPEVGTTFWVQSDDVSDRAKGYANWFPGEPDNGSLVLDSDEDFLLWNWGAEPNSWQRNPIRLQEPSDVTSMGKWSDDSAPYLVRGAVRFIVEYSPDSDDAAAVQTTAEER